MLPYGLIGNCLTAALVKKDASIDWMCYPYFNSPSIFTRILDEDAGHFSIKPKGRYSITQRYIPETAVLETTFTSKTDSFRVIDFYPRYKALLVGKYHKLEEQNMLVRIIKRVRGTPVIRLNLKPRPDYDQGHFERFESKLVSRDLTLSVYSNFNDEVLYSGEELAIDKPKYVVLSQNDNLRFDIRRVWQLFQSTKRYWKRWCASLSVPKQNRNRIIRSAITLKLLTYSKTGAIIAAPTTSIPEEVGTDRTFDYRQCWIRDASFCVDALKKIGRSYEAKKLMEYILNIVCERDELHIMYGINGESDLEEKEIPHLKGFMGSRPVRVGNAAYDQKQHDIYGEVLDIMYLYFIYYEYEKRMPTKYWKLIDFLVDKIQKNWQTEDSGIWEFRAIHRHYTFSKLMCYVGMDRAVRIAEHFRRFERAYRWKGLAEEIKADLILNGYNTNKEAFTMYYGSKELDASLLQMTYHEFLQNTDIRIINTVNRIYEELTDDHLVQRYKIKDDFGVPRSSFTICSFWMVDALYYIGEHAKAQRMYDKLNRHANHLGLFSEDIDIATGKLIGNFPQGYTHIALINSSILLSEWSVKRKAVEKVVRYSK